MPNLITVAATDNDDGLASFSNWGATSVDLGGPGVHVYQASAGGTYAFRNGTSFSAPHATGVVALAWTRYPLMSWRGVRYKVLFTTENVFALEAKTAFRGLVNARNALDCNLNGVLDDQDIASQTSQDCNGNLIPDSCEPNADCNNNGIQDMCDIGAGTSQDCTGNAIPDECEGAMGGVLHARRGLHGYARVLLPAGRGNIQGGPDELRRLACGSLQWLLRPQRGLLRDIEIVLRSGRRVLSGYTLQHLVSQVRRNPTVALAKGPRSPLPCKDTGVT